MGTKLTLVRDRDLPLGASALTVEMVYLFRVAVSAV